MSKFQRMSNMNIQGMGRTSYAITEKPKPLFMNLKKTKRVKQRNNTMMLA
jgi:hypothetical protein